MSEKILIVEDKDEHLLAVPELQKRGFCVDVARTYIEASDHLGTVNYDIVLTDLMFPYERSGNEEPLGYPFVLKSVTKNVPRIALYTDMNHHQGPIAETFNSLDVPKGYEGQTISRASSNKRIFRMNKSLVAFLDIRGIHHFAHNPSTGEMIFEDEDSEGFWKSKKRGFELEFQKKNYLALANRMRELKF